MPKNASDKEVIQQLGAEALSTLGYSRDVIKKWRQRGIPWKERARIAALAARQKVKLPADFLHERRGAQEAAASPPGKFPKSRPATEAA